MEETGSLRRFNSPVHKSGAGFGCTPVDFITGIAGRQNFDCDANKSQQITATTKCKERDDPYGRPFFFVIKPRKEREDETIRVGINGKTIPEGEFATEAMKCARKQWGQKAPKQSLQRDKETQVMKANDSFEEWLYLSIKQLPQDVYNAPIPWSDKWRPYIPQLRDWESQRLIKTQDTATSGNEFSKGFRIKSPLILQLAENLEDAGKLTELHAAIKDSTHLLVAAELAKSLALPTATVYAAFDNYAKRNHGTLSFDGTRCEYHPRPRS